MWWTTLPAISATTPAPAATHRPPAGPPPAEPHQLPGGPQAAVSGPRGSPRHGRRGPGIPDPRAGPGVHTGVGAAGRAIASSQPGGSVTGANGRPDSRRQRHDLRGRQRAPVGAGPIGIDDDVRGQRADLVAGVEYPGSADTVGPGAVTGERGLVHVAGEHDVGLVMLDPTTHDLVAEALPAVPARGELAGGA